MIKKIFYSILLILSLTSCSSYMEMLNADGNIRRVKIGMTEDQIESLMGKHYEVVGATGESTVWAYRTSNSAMYKFRFVNGRLAEWNKVWPRRYENNSDDTAFMKKDKKNDNTSTKFHLQAHRNAMLSTATSDSQRHHINAHMDAVEKSMLDE